MKTYTGGCHCKQVRYSVTMELDKVIECNCSFCVMKGLLLAFTPGGNFTLTSGTEAELPDYRFNKKRISHMFCPSCGVQSYSRAVSADGVDTIAINVRCLDDVDLATLERIPFDGKSA